MTILTDVKAEKHLKEVLTLDNIGSGIYTHPTDKDVQGGYYYQDSKNRWVGFTYDNNKHCTFRFFDNGYKACYYASGILKDGDL